MLRTEVRTPLPSVLRDVTLEVELGSLGDQTFATLLTAALDAIAASFGGHAGTETVLLFAGTFGGLVCTEAHGGIFGEISVPAKARRWDFRWRKRLVNAAVRCF